MVSQTYAIETRGLKKSFGKLQVLKGLDLKVRPGTITALLGPNGAGKTTTIRILATLLQPDGGQVTIQGYDVVAAADKVRSLIGLTGQYAAIDEYLTGRENLRMMGRLYHLSRTDAYRRAEELLREFDLVAAANRPAKTYSGGMSRRLDLAASLIATPPVIFLDEPTTGLDPRSRLAMWEVVQQLSARGATILLTTQQLEEADQLADHIVVIDGGKIIAEGTADQLKTKVGKDRIEFSFSNRTDWEAAAKLLTSKSLQTDSKRLTVSLANPGGIKKVSELIQRLTSQQLKIESLSLHKPTLDDVFLHLTGRRAVSQVRSPANKKGK